MVFYDECSWVTNHCLNQTSPACAAARGANRHRVCLCLSPWPSPWVPAPSKVSPFHGRTLCFNTGKAHLFIVPGQKSKKAIGSILLHSEKLAWNKGILWGCSRNTLGQSPTRPAGRQHWDKQAQGNILLGMGLGPLLHHVFFVTSCCAEGRWVMDAAPTQQHRGLQALTHAGSN